ncbi:hypothetical protein HHK36_019136 [Tetracentron sinense]|uniref:SHSP domain-containing protein n=1 Tax=Tetracentron sinense TaxID=13715 RepID=A0A835DCH5_TETSI|nr:hypothetical protein HHK36_019136 [Tetracentron sinense]
MSITPTISGGRRSNVDDPFPLDNWGSFQDSPFSTSLSATRPEFSNETVAFANTRVDWKETPEAHVFKADLPGLKKEEVKVVVQEGRVLQISGERRKEKEEKNGTWHRVERSSGKFLRRFRLPENSKLDLVKACMVNGVLTVTVPKEESPLLSACQGSGISLVFPLSPIVVQALSEKGVTGFMTDFLMGGVSVAISKIAAAPFERVKLLIQNHYEMIKTDRLSEPYKGSGDCFARKVSFHYGGATLPICVSPGSSSQRY